MARNKKNSKVVKPTQKTLKGRGDYTQQDRELLLRIDKKIPEISSGKIGRTLGNFFGRGDLGETLGKGVGSLFGMGDYTVKSNSLMPEANNLSASQVPVFTKDGKRGVRIVEREFVKDIVGSTTFVNTQFTIDPLNASTFPWLSKIASQFEQWEPNGMVFQFVSTSSEFNGSGQALGTVVLATDYDVYDPAPATKVQMENYDYAQSTKPSESCIHGVECDPKERPNEILYVGSTGPDLRFSQLGNFNVATTGMTGSPVVGELWISYDITFYKKQLDSVDLSLRLQTSSAAVTSGSPTLGTATVKPSSSKQFKVEQIIGTGTRIYFPPNAGAGNFQLLYVLDTTGSMTISPTVNNFTIYQNHSVSNGTALVAELNGYITAPGAYIQFGLATTSGTSNTFTICAVPDDFF